MNNDSNCICGNNIPYNDCCLPLLDGFKKAETAEALMRSRYSAYSVKNYDYIINTCSEDNRPTESAEELNKASENIEWQKLDVLHTEKGSTEDDEGIVHYIANYTDNGSNFVINEISHFKKIDGVWFYTHGEFPGPKPVKKEAKIGRNDPCICGSGKKYKKCCLK